MGSIRVLPPQLADRIAAGEIVERPASVLRELLDNSLDAGAKRIDVTLAEGGSDLIEVADDGAGMSPDDAVLALERHATSKIATLGDLDAIATLGFRGEALAAIASVSRLELETRHAAAPSGVAVVADNGRVISEKPLARAAGTTIRVHGLFRDVPARRKFLRARATELDHCLRALTRSALPRHEVAFRASHDGRDVFRVAATGDPGVRVAEVLGARWGKNLIAAASEAKTMELRAWCARSDVHRPTREGIHVFVNGRGVRDPFLMRAVTDAFRGKIPAGRFPVIVAFLDVDPEGVDVNVHPAKTEVRFRAPREVRSFVVGALEGVLRTHSAVSSFVPAASSPYAAPGSSASTDAGDGDHRRSPAVIRVAEGVSTSLFEVQRPTAGEAAPGEFGATGEGEQEIRALAQYAQRYIVACDAEGLLVVDQHTAHERVVYESLSAEADAGPLPRQALMFPRPLELGPHLYDLASKHHAELEKLGFRTEDYGSGSVLVREVPAIFGRGAKADTFEELLAEIERGDIPEAKTIGHRILATIACHASVRKGMDLSIDKMNHILGKLVRCRNRSHCPHGRVISLRVGLEPLDRQFGRL